MFISVSLSEFLFASGNMKWSLVCEQRTGVLCKNILKGLRGGEPNQNKFTRVRGGAYTSAICISRDVQHSVEQLVH